MTATKFRTLRLFAAIHIAFGVLLILAGIFVVLVMAGVASNVDDKLASLLAGAFGIGLTIGLVMAGIAWIAYGQFLQVVMQIEENTRKE
jgi:hypothetical protein